MFQKGHLDALGSQGLGFRAGYALVGVKGASALAEDLSPMGAGGSGLSKREASGIFSRRTRAKKKKKRLTSFSIESKPWFTSNQSNYDKVH